MTLKHIVSRLFTLLIAVVLVGVFTFDAEARRMGGGKSMGRQSSNVTQRQATPPAAPGNTTQSAATAGAAGAGTAAVAATRKPWGAMLGGLAAGLGLAWLANSLGLGPAFANMLLFLLLGVVVLAVIGMIRRSRAGAPAGNALAYQGAGAAGSASAPVTPRQYNPTKVGNDASARPWESQPAQFSGAGAAAAGGSMIGSALSGSQNWGVPADFDVQGFTESAKRNFVTLQDAWDRSDIASLRTMMTDDMLAEIQSQLAERERTAPGQANQTDVVMLEAQLLGIEELDDIYMASVEFSGMIREQPSAGPSPFREVWNMTKPKNGASGWLVAGVQALQ